MIDRIWKKGERWEFRFVGTIDEDGDLQLAPIDGHIVSADLFRATSAERLADPPPAWRRGSVVRVRDTTLVRQANGVWQCDDELCVELHNDHQINEDWASFRVELIPT
jgi:hypothetical protein